MKRTIIAALAAMLASAPGVAKPLDYQVIRTSATSMHANMVLAKGEKMIEFFDQA